MLNKDQFLEAIKGFEHRSEFLAKCTKNMDAYVGDVANEKYLPKYSAKENRLDYSDRLKRAQNSYMNFVQQILNIYQNAIFRTTGAQRETKSDVLKRFMKNVDGAGTHISEFVRDQVFVFNQVHGGCLVVIDKPKIPEKLKGKKITEKDKRDFKLFPYAYLRTWDEVVNFKLDRFNALDWIIFSEEYEDEKVYKYWDKEAWGIYDVKGNLIDKGIHGLGETPVIRSFAKKNPKYKFKLPLSPMDDIVRLSLKIFELSSQLDQMIVGHVFLKLVMSETMYRKVKESGLGVFNILVQADGTQGQEAYYVNTPATEIDKMTDLIFDKYPNMILRLATVRDKVAMPREESGTAKFIDSSDETANLLDKAEKMEWVENEMVRLAALWEDIDLEKTQTRISYSKVFDIKSTNEQIEEMIQIFKQDLKTPTLHKNIVKMVARKILGRIDEKTWAQIEEEIESSIDPSLDLNDIEILSQLGVIKLIKLARIYNDDLKTATDEQVLEFINGNLKTLRGAEAPVEF